MTSWMFVGVWGAGSCLFSLGRLSDSEDPTAKDELGDLSVFGLQKQINQGV